jgi:hypothetical protein
MRTAGISTNAVGEHLKKMVVFSRLGWSAYADLYGQQEAGLHRLQFTSWQSIVMKLQVQFMESSQDTLLNQSEGQ